MNTSERKKVIIMLDLRVMAVRELVKEHYKGGCWVYEISRIFVSINIKL